MKTLAKYFPASGTILLVAIAALLSCSQGKQPTGKNMNETKEIKPTEIKENAVELFDRKWALVTAGMPGDVNTMTISWGSLGELWNKPVVTVYVSSSRYTHEYMEKNDHFTVAFFPDECRGALQYLGSHSGRDGDKIKESGLTLEWLESGLPSFKEADMIIEFTVHRSIPKDSAKFPPRPTPPAGWASTRNTLARLSMSGSVAGTENDTVEYDILQITTLLLYDI